MDSSRKWKASRRKEAAEVEEDARRQSELHGLPLREMSDGVVAWLGQKGDVLEFGRGREDRLKRESSFPAGPASLSSFAGEAVTATLVSQQSSRRQTCTPDNASRFSFRSWSHSAVSFPHSLF